jgi:hypothetical protein
MTDMEWNDGGSTELSSGGDLTARQRLGRSIATCPSCSKRRINPYGRHHPRVEVAAEDSMGNGGQPPSWKSMSLQQSQRTQTANNNANGSSNNNNMPPVPGVAQDMLGRHEQNILNKIILQTETTSVSGPRSTRGDSCSKLGKKGAGLLDSKNWSGRGLWEGLRIRRQEHQEWHRCSLPVDWSRLR